MNPFILLLNLLLTHHLPDFKKEVKIADELSVGPTVTVVIDNVFGQVEVRQGSSDKVSYRVLKTISAKSQPLLDKGLQELKLKVLEHNDSVIFFTDAPFICQHWNGCDEGKHYSWDDSQYDFKLDYLIEIPKSVNLNVQTVTGGSVEVHGIEGIIKANNVDGSITISGAVDVIEASTVNGNVDIHYKEVPKIDCRFHTINGAINIYCKENLNAIITTKTMHGELYSAFDYKALKPKLVKKTDKSGNTTTYKLEETFGLEIGQNGPKLSFETLNGDIYLRKL